MKYIEKSAELAIDIAATIAAIYFVGMQGYFCLRHPFEWFTSLVAIIVLCTCFLVHYRQADPEQPPK